MKPPITPVLAAGLLWAAHLSASAAIPGEVEQAITTLQAVSREGAGNEAATGAWQSLSQADTSALLPILGAMEHAGPVAQNYLRSAAEVIVSKGLQEGTELPVASLGEFLLDTRQDPQARRFAYEVIARVQPETAERLIPGMLNDPSTDLRRDAVARLITEAKSLKEGKEAQAATLIYLQALNAARDVDQIKEITKQLEGLGQSVDLPRHFGFLMHWKVIGPFDNTGLEGFNTPYPPEQGIDLSATYDGKEGPVTWSDFATADDYGMVDINQAYGPLKEVTAYAFTEFNSASTQPAELRLGCKNAWKIWLNGELIFGRDEYHRGARIDQYILPIQLKEGKNEILVKLCQNEQVKDWTVQWEFQLRVCDATGTAILAVDRPPTPEKEIKSRRELRNQN